MKKIFVVNSSGHDLSNAERFGQLVIMTRGTVAKYHITELFRTFNEYMANSGSEDYILISGPTVLNCIACGYFVAKHGKLNLLLFTGEKYISREVAFREVLCEEKK